MSRTDSSADTDDQIADVPIHPDANKDPSSLELTDSQHSQCANTDDRRDANNGSPSQNTRPPDQDSNHDQPIQDTNDEMPQKQHLGSGAPTQDSKTIHPYRAVQLYQPVNSGAPTDNPYEDGMTTGNDQNAEELDEQGEADVTQTLPEPDQPVESTPASAKDTEVNVAEGIPSPEETEQNQIIDNEEYSTQDNAQRYEIPSDIDTSQDQEAASSENINGVSSPQSPVQLEPPSSVRDGQTGIEAAPDSLQLNNNNELNQGDEFDKYGSVRIPTAGMGDVDETNRQGGSQEDLRDSAMHKMRSSIPMDARGGMYSDL